MQEAKPDSPARQTKQEHLTAGGTQPYVRAQMAVLPIITIPDPVLRKQAAAGRAGRRCRCSKLAEDMLATMYDAPGIGLAAPQIGVPRG